MQIFIKIVFISFFLIFSGCATLNKGNFGQFKRSLNNTFYGYRVVKDPTGKAPTEHVEIFEVRNGDCASDGHWSDCANDRERSELSGSKDNYPGSEFWYGWYIYVPRNYVNIYPTKTALGQFHQKSSHPVWMFQNSNGGLYLDQQVHGSTEKYYKLLDKDELRGKWHQIKLHIKWSRNNDGFFYVWVNGKQKVKYNGQTMDASQVYFKYGVYRSFLRRYKAEKQSEWLMSLPKNAEIPDYENIPKVKVPTQIVYYSNVRRSNDEAGLNLN
jgi:hypothetical protein